MAETSAKLREPVAKRTGDAASAAHAPSQCACASAPSSAYACPRCRAKARLNRFGTGTTPAFAPPIVHDVLGSAGAPLDGHRRALMEPRFGRDFAHVRVHAGPLAEASARAVNALAYTVGSHIVLGVDRSAAADALLAHELAHVVQQRDVRSIPSSLPIDKAHSAEEREAHRIAASFPRADAPVRIETIGGARLQRQPTPTPSDAPGEVLFEEPERCEDKQDVTERFSDFVRDANDLIASMRGATDEQRRGLREMADLVLHTEGAADIGNYRIVSCSRISSDLTAGAEFAEAYVDSGSREVGMLQRIAGLMDAVRLRPNPEQMTEFLQVIAHEKRHVTLGGAVDVERAALRPGRDEIAARHATYRAEEILATAEEIAVGRMALGREFIVERDKQEKLYRLRNMIRGWVTEEAWQELRTRIIRQLRDRYGFTAGCDNALTLGVVSSLERNEWHSCDYERGVVTSRVPEGLNVCTGAHTPCPTRSRR